MKTAFKLRGQLTIFVVIFLFSCAEEKVKREIIRPVRYQQVFLSGSEQTRTFSGLSKSGTEAKLSFRVGGIVDKLNVKVGDKIRKGALIAFVDDADAQLNYQKTLATLKKTETQKDIANSNLARVKSLYENNNVALSEYEAAKDKYASANSSFNTEKRNADLRKRELGYYKLYAPIDGIIAEVPIRENEQLSPGQVAAVISSEDDIEVSVGMPEAFITRVKAGKKVSVKFLSLSAKIFDGTVSEVSFTTAGESSTYPVTVKIEHPTSDIRPGMSADVTFDFTSASNQSSQSLVVPANSVGEDTEGNFVFTVSESDDGLATVQKKTIAVGTLTRDGFEIISGLQDGELVVTAGIANLSNGMKVRLLK